MANDKNKESGGLDLGELGMIRNILMGQQVTEFEARFTNIESDISQNNAALETRIAELEKAAFNAQDAMQKDMHARLDKLEKSVEKRLDQLENKLVDTSQKNRQKVGKLLADIGKKLLES